MKATIAFFAAAVLLASSAWGQSPAQVGFVNDGSTLITNCFDHLPQAKSIYVQLCFTPDLSAVTDVAARASMLLVGTPARLILPGRFNGGSVTLPGASIGSQVVLQVKAWTTNYPSFEQALANGGDVAESLVWVQTTGGGITPPPIISRWGFRTFLFPQCELPRVPLFVERSRDSRVLVSWPVGVPPSVQVSDDSGATWRPLTSGTFVQDHWEFEIPPTNGVRFFRLAQ